MTSSRRARPPPSSFLLDWRGEADPKHVKAIDTYWICTAEHGLNASTFTARVVASTGADCGAALSVGRRRALGPAARRCPGVRDADARRGRGNGGSGRLGRPTLLDERQAPHGLRPPRSTGPRTRARACSAARRRSSARSTSRWPRSSSRSLSRSCRSAQPDRVLATNVEYYSAIVLDVAEIPPPLVPAMFACSRVAGWSAHILEQKRTGRLFRPEARYVGPGPRSLQPS